jgi:hypothetical protein
VTLFEPEPPTVPEHRVRALAGVLAGFQWPDRGSFEKLTKPQQAIAAVVARDALERLERETCGS